MKIRSWLTRVVLASAVIVGVSALPSTAFAGGFKVPFTDPNQIGSLTLCNPQEQPITTGSLLSVPFVWRAVSSVPAPKGYTRATLDLFQPIEYVQPGDWSGYQLTDDAVFSNKAHPMAQATYADGPLLWPDHSMAPHWDGLYELRMVFTSPDTQPWTLTYPTAVIKVTGNEWTLVQGGGSSCTDGTAESIESLLLPRSETAVPKPPVKEFPYSKPTKKPKGGSAPPSSTQPPGGSSTTTTSGSSSRSASGDPSGTSSKGGGSSAGAIVAGAIAALLLAGAASLFVFRRRRRVA